MAGRQPRYQINTAVPGGVMPRGIMEVADAAKGLTDFIAGKTSEYAVDVGTPIARAEGEKAGTDIGWAPKPAIGDVAKAYEQAALRTHDFTIENEFKRKYEETFSDLKDTPNGMNLLDKEWDARTKPLVGAVSKERQPAAQAISDNYKKQAYSQLLVADTANMEKLADGRRAALIQSHTDSMFNASFRGDMDGVRYNKDKIDSMWMDSFGKPYVSDPKSPDGKRFLTFDEFTNLDYDEKGNRRLDASGNPVDGVKANGVGFMMRVSGDVADAVSYRKKSGSSLAQFTVMGGFQRAQEEPDGGVGFLSRFTDNMESFTDLEPDDRIQLQQHMTSQIRRSLRQDDAANRTAEKKRKQDVEGVNARVFGALQLGQDVPQDALKYVSENADIDPDGATKVFAAIKSAGVTESQPGDVAMIQGFIAAGKFGEASDQIDRSHSTLALAPTTRDALEKQLSQARKEVDDGPLSHPSVKLSLDSAEYKITLAVNPAGKNMFSGTVFGSVDDSKVVDAFMAEIRNSISNETNNEPPAKWKKIADDIVARTLSNMSKPPASVTSSDTWWRNRARFANVIASSPMGAGEYIDDADGYINAYKYKAYLRDGRDRGNISDEDYAEWVKLADRQIAIQDLDPVARRKQEKFRSDSETLAGEVRLRKAQVAQKYADWVRDILGPFARMPKPAKPSKF